MLLFVFLLEMCSSVPWAEGAAAVQKRAQACYQDLGCFDSTPQIPLPKSPAEMMTQFQLYTRSGQDQPVRINATFNETTWSSLLAGSHYNAHKDTKFVIHGYFDNGNKTWILQMKDALLSKADVNVFVLDWGQGSHDLPTRAAANVFVVAAELAKFLRYLQINNGLDLSKVHFIGHSFGAQISGNAGGALQGAIGRISGMDPAEPYFVDMDNSKRLDKTDAQFVDVIHTDGEKFNGLQGYGAFYPMGHVDFYPNGGVDQPGCEDDLLGGIFGILGGQDGDKSVACSHGRAHEFYIESITSSGSCQFTSYPCADWDQYLTGICHTCPAGGCPVMGYNSDASSAQGSFYLTTTMNSPYCGYEYQIEIDLTDNHPTENAFGRFFVTLHGQHVSQEAEFSRDNVHYHQRFVETQVIAVQRKVGTVSGVEVRFHHQGGLQGLGTDSSVFVHKIVVRDTTTGDSATFCTDDAEMTSDHSVLVSNQQGC